MAKPLAGYRYFYALGERNHAHGLKLAKVRLDALPLWASNAYVRGHFGAGIRRLPAHLTAAHPTHNGDDNGK